MPRKVRGLRTLKKELKCKFSYFWYLSDAEIQINDDEVEIKIHKYDDSML